MHPLITLTFVLVFSVSALAAVQFEQGEKLRCFIIPADQGIVAVASQPDSPLVFEDVRIISCNGRGMNSYRLRNRGLKPIRSYQIAGWTSGGTGFKSGWGGSTPGEVIMPGDLAPIKEHEAELLPLTKELRKKLKLDGPMEAVLILIVESVEYTDGTSFNNEAASKALEDYFEMVGGKIP